MIFFTSLVQRYLEYRRFRNSEDETLRKAVKPFWSNALRTCIWCCAFYILIPAAIYLLSYLPYVLSVDRYGIKEIWGVQEFMFSYHSGLTATHSYQSPWWQWPLLIRPMWYYVGYDVAPGNISTIRPWEILPCGGSVRQRRALLSILSCAANARGIRSFLFCLWDFSQTICHGS